MSAWRLRFGGDVPRHPDVFSEEHPQGWGTWWFPGRWVIAGVLGVLVLASLALRSSSELRRLQAVIGRLSPDVGIVILEPVADAPTDTLRLRQALDTLGVLPPPTVPARVHPVVTVVVDTPDGAQRVVLLDPAEAARERLTGSSVGGWVAVGAAADRAFRVPSARAPLDPAVTRLLRVDGGIRLLVRQSWLAQTVPLLARGLAEERLLTLELRGDPRHVRLSGTVPNSQALLRGARPLLRDDPPGAVLVLDGAPVRAVLPETLPPILAALRDESGVAGEIRSLALLLADAPSTLVLQLAPNGNLYAAFGILVPTTADHAALRGSLQALLARRITISDAVVEQVRENGRVIRHLRPSSGASDRLREERQGALEFWTARALVGQGDLVGVLGPRTLLLGTDRDLALAVAEEVEQSEVEPVERKGVRVAVDGDLLRRVPVVALALRGFSPHVRPWAAMLGALRIDVREERPDLTFTVTGEFREPPE